VAERNTALRQRLAFLPGRRRRYDRAAHRAVRGRRAQKWWCAAL